jgi:2-dehydropantoate 2-reductase
MQINKITIVGMGALGVMFGSFLTGKLGKAHVEFIADEKRINKFHTEGMFCNGRPCHFSIVNDDAEGTASNLLIFAVKAAELAGAIHTVRNKVSNQTIIMSLLNGITSEEIISATYGMDKIIHCVVQGMDVVKEKNRGAYSHFGYICLGIDEESEEKKQKLQYVLELFDAVHMPYVVDTDILHRLWCKFMINVGVNQAVMIHQGTYATVQKPGDARDLMIRAMKEVITIAQTENITITQEDFHDYLKLLDGLDPNALPSMRQDALAHRKSEVELFAGTVIALANKHGIDVPVNTEIYRTIIEMESRY